MSKWESVNGNVYTRDLQANGHAVVTWESHRGKWRWDHYDSYGWVAHSAGHNTAMSAMGDFDGWWPLDASQTR